MLTSRVIAGPAGPFLSSVAIVALGFSNIAVAQRSSQTPLTISGKPATIANVGQIYTFTPRVSGERSRNIRFSVSNKPGWIYFSSYRGTLYGIPSKRNIGTYRNIVITVYDGRRAAKLAPFSITVKDPSAPAPTPTPTPSPTPTPTPTPAPTPTPTPTPAPTPTPTPTPTPAPTPTPTPTPTPAPTPTPTPTPTPAPTPTPTPTNTPPTLSGAPATTVTAGQAYSFRPSASDADGDRLTFSISGRPAWATFNSSTGQLSGTPTTAGTFSGIVISVSDGRGGTRSIGPFAITVTAPTTNGTAEISWTPPTTNTDGSSLTNLAGYRISYGTSANGLTKTIQVPTAGITSYVVENLTAGTWYFSVRAYTANGTESAQSAVVSKTIK